MRVLAALEEELTAMRHRLLADAAHLRGAKALSGAIYGVGPVTGLALTCWLGGKDRFSSARKAVRFAGLDITVYSSDRKRPPGHLSRQGPPVLRWCAYEAGKVSAHTTAPDHSYYAAVKDRAGGKRAAARRGPQNHPAGLPHPHRAWRRRVHHGVTVTGRGTGGRTDPGRAPSSADEAQPRPVPAMTLSGRLCPAGRGSRRTACID